MGKGKSSHYVKSKPMFWPKKLCKKKRNSETELTNKQNKNNINIQKNTRATQDISLSFLYRKMHKLHMTLHCYSAHNKKKHTKKPLSVWNRSLQHLKVILPEQEHSDWQFQISKVTLQCLGKSSQQVQLVHSSKASFQNKNFSINKKKIKNKKKRGQRKEGGHGAEREKNVCSV